MRADSPRESGRLAWLLRHYAWLVLVCVLAFAGAPLLLGAATPVYQADAIVVAGQLTVNERVLPQLGEAVFSNGAVAEQVAEDPDVEGNGAGLVPSRLSVVVPQNSIVLIVQARDREPEVAARMADLGATALAAELNGGGAGVGQFDVRAPAVVPNEPLQATSPELLAATGALAGLLVGIGLAALLGVLRRPVVTSRDVEEAVGTPLLGRVDVPLGPPGSYPGPLGVRGLAKVTRLLATVPAGRLLLISPVSAVGLRQRLYVMVAVALSTVRPVLFRASSELVDAIGKHRAGLRRSVPRPGSDPLDGQIVLVDGGTPFEILDANEANVTVVAIAPRGITRGRLRVLADDYQDAGLVGVVLVDTHRAPRRKSERRPRPAAPAAVKDTEERKATVPAPERA